MNPPRVLCYVQHLMGIGHQRRMAAISRELCAQGALVTYVSGGFPLADLDPGPVRFVQLPPARAADLSYKQLVDLQGEPVDDTWRQQRREMLLDTYRDAQPDALVIETFPFGRRMLRFELLPLLEAARGRAQRPVIICSARDIIEHRGCSERSAEILDYVQRYFDLVLVHGDPRFVPFDHSFPPAAAITEKIRYTGYVMYAPPAAQPLGTTGNGEVLVSAGGGAYGEHVLRAALKARPLSNLAACTWRILVGGNIGEDGFRALRSHTRTGVIVERNRSDFPVLLRNCRLSISQGGYNTVLEILNAGARAVIVPYQDEREKEQAVRAELLAEGGFVNVVADKQLSADTLAAAIDRADTRAPPLAGVIDTTGAKRSARIISDTVARQNAE
jgi:predicted glycosyltransferase